jgi:4-hydroxy-tetrahydrodipicolinate synthase
VIPVGGKYVQDLQLVEKALNGRISKRSLEAQFRLAPLRLAFDLGTFPVVIKEALNLIGIEAA